MLQITTAACFSLIVVGVYLTPLFLQVIVNPDSLREEPTNKRKAEIIENRKSWSVGVFAINVVIANFILTENQPLEQGEILALTAVILSTVFLMLTYELEGFAGLTRVFYRAQEYALEFGGFLLFISLFFLVDTLSPVPILSWLLGIGISVILITWTIRTVIYVFGAQTN